jgi:hypothetical protein
VGVPAALGHGVFEVQKFEVFSVPDAAKVSLPGLIPSRRTGPESALILSAIIASIYRPLVQFAPVPTYRHRHSNHLRRM